MSDDSIHLDIDIWGYGRDAARAGKFTTSAMKAHYPYVGFEETKALFLMLRELQSQIEPNIHGQRTFFSIGKDIFFQNEEDAALCRALRYII